MSVLDNPLLFSQRLDTLGTGLGTTNANGNYSSTADDFYIQAQGGDILNVARLIIFIEDTGNILADGYGAIAAPGLTNGITFEIRESNDTVIASLPFTVHSNAEWAALCHDLSEHTFGSGNNFLSARWTFSAFGAPIRLRDGQKFVVILNDDLSGLVSHYFTVQGIFENRTI